MSKERNFSEPEIETIAAMAKELLLTEGAHLPTVIVVGNLGRCMGQLDGNLETSEDRARAMTILGEGIGKEGSIGELHKVFFIGEGWLSKAARTDPTIQPSNDPNRIEILLVSEIDLPKEKTNLLLYEMVRNETGELKEVKPYQVEEKTTDADTKSYLLEAFVRGYYLGNNQGNGKHLH